MCRPYTGACNVLPVVALDPLVLLSLLDDDDLVDAALAGHGHGADVDHLGSGERALADGDRLKSYVRGCGVVVVVVVMVVVIVVDGNGSRGGCRSRSGRGAGTGNGARGRDGGAGSGKGSGVGVDVVVAVMVNVVVDVDGGGLVVGGAVVDGDHVRGLADLEVGGVAGQLQSGSCRNNLGRGHVH